MFILYIFHVHKIRDEKKQIKYTANAVLCPTLSKLNFVLPFSVCQHFI